MLRSMADAIFDIVPDEIACGLHFRFQLMAIGSSANLTSCGVVIGASQGPAKTAWSSPFFALPAQASQRLCHPRRSDSRNALASVLYSTSGNAQPLSAVVPALIAAFCRCTVSGAN
jgi:hypothetical protein